MERFKNLSMEHCPSYLGDMAEEPLSFELLMNSMHQALEGIKDEALMDIEEKYGKNYQHFAVIRPTWMSLEPPADLHIWASILKEQKCDEEAIYALRELISAPGFC